MTRRFDCIVVGAGPAGAEAAVTAAGCGAAVALVDLQRHVGGQYGMPAASDVQARAAGPALGRELAEAVASAGVETITGAEVFAAESGFRLGVVKADAPASALVLTAPALVAATGAQERVLPFPGWTLPGVMTAGALQRLLKSGAVRDDRRVVLAGSGVFLAAVAQTMLKENRRCRAVVHPRPSPAAAIAALAPSPGRWSEAAGLARALLAAGEHRFPSHAVVAALGGSRLEAVRVAPVGPDGKPDSLAAVEIACDTLAVSHGFMPVIELAASLGAALDHAGELGGWHVRADGSTGETSVAGLFAAGEVTGVAGAAAARLGGRIAGFGVAARLGFAQSPADGLVAAYGRARAFGRRVARIFPDPFAGDPWPAGDTVLCRCEGVTFAAVRAAIADGAATVANLRTWTRAGMGACQGRVCGANARALLAAALNRTEASLGVPPARFPLRPAPMDAVSAWSKDEP